MADLTSITQAKLSAFKKTATPRQQLGCDKISGFFYLKLSRGGAWRLRYTDLLGKRRTATIADTSIKPNQAAEEAISWKAKLREGIDPLSYKEELAQIQREEEQLKAANVYMTVGAFYESIYTPHKLDNYRYGAGTLKVIKHNFEHLFKRDMDKLNSADILQWYNMRKGKGIKRSTLVRDFGAFKAMLNFATQPLKGVNEPILKVNPIKSFTLPALTIKEQDELEAHNEKLSHQRDIFSNEVKQQIHKGLSLYSEKVKKQRRSSIAHGKSHLINLDSLTYPHWFIPFCHIARLTGMRPSDIYALKWENLLFNQFNDQTTLIFTPSKTKKAENSRKIKFPVTGELKYVFECWAEQQEQAKHGLIFKSERTSRSLERKAHLRHWKQVKALGGVPESLDFYSFRHNFISELVARGVPVLTIAGLVGHKDGSMIAANYLRHDENDIASILSNLNNFNEVSNAKTL
ncbi:integrase family protein [Pseudoalteromonas tetraodonis]|uniref:integrase family protein n=1 Tax=Pseudoalteromonas tetraodonis TaxID=43659 RepID=UPI000849BC89|nr:integrase family protein [Pseudoalteromonas tetraodonis]ODS14597.1 site-specific recombinase [Pseudoalteromonas tetraodonis]